MATSTTVVTNVCAGCQQRLDTASTAMRRHAAELNSALQSARSGRLTEEIRQSLQMSLSASFSEAQSAWDMYRAHLIEHGIKLGDVLKG